MSGSEQQRAVAELCGVKLEGAGRDGWGKVCARGEDQVMPQ